MFQRFVSLVSMRVSRPDNGSVQHVILLSDNRTFILSSSSDESSFFLSIYYFEPVLYLQFGFGVILTDHSFITLLIPLPQCRIHSCFNTICTGRDIMRRIYLSTVQIFMLLTFDPCIPLACFGLTRFLTFHHAGITSCEFNCEHLVSQGMI